MNAQITPPPQRNFDMTVPSALALHWLRLWQTPLILGTAWWNAALQLGWPPHHLDHVLGDPHGQLPVPDPIEQDGERALVA